MCKCEKDCEEGCGCKKSWLGKIFCGKNCCKVNKQEEVKPTIEIPTSENQQTM